MMEYEQIEALRVGNTMNRDRAAREFAAVVRGNIEVLLSELADILATNQSMHYTAELWLSPLAQAETRLAQAVAQAAKAAGLVSYE